MASAVFKVEVQLMAENVDADKARGALMMRKLAKKMSGTMREKKSTTVMHKLIMMAIAVLKV